MAEILVTGGAGFIGSHLIQALSQAGYSVVNIDELNDYYNPAFKQYNLAQLPKHSFYQGSVCDEKFLEQIFQKHDITKVVHLGARAGVRPSLQQPQLYDEVNFGGTKKLVDRASTHGVTQFIFGSTSAVYGNTATLPFSEDLINLNPISPYAISKLKAERYLHEHHVRTGLPVTIFRFFTVYGERGRPDMAPYLFTEAILHQQPIKKFGDGSTSRDYTYIDDIISGIMTAIERSFDFEIINLGNHQAVSLNEFISTLEHVTGKTAVIEQLPAQSGDVNHTLADILKARRLLNYEPKTSLQEGLQRFVNWYYATRYSR
ncbi:MAG: nad-dependent epimerase/dehydratase [uncultured bacterium]|nr:MAG: nad-dependent epimerase/dehydratase [uncultured bacterium]